MSNFFKRLKSTDIDFRSYSQKENDFRRLAYINLVVCIIIAPIFCWVIKDTEISSIYFYLGLSYTVCFPVYITICWFVEILRDKLYQFFIFHLFVMTLFAFFDLIDNNFEIIDLISFYCLFSISIFIIQRLYISLIYVLYVSSLMLYAFQFTSSDQLLSKEMMLGFILAISVVCLLSLYSRNQMLSSVFDFNSYLERLSQGVKFGFVLFRFDNEKIEVLDFNDDIQIISTSKEKQEVKISLSKIFGDKLTKNDIRNLLKLQGNEYITKIIKVENQSFEMVFSPIKVNKIDCFLVKTNNVTDRIKEQEELILSEEKYRNLYHENQAGIFTLNTSFRLVNFNRTFEQIFENSFKVGDHFVNDDNEMKELLDIISETVRFNNYQTHFTLNNGSTKWLVFNFYFDELHQYIEGSVVDVSDIQKASNALRKSEEKYKLMYEESNDAILILDGSRVIDVNRRGMQIFGIPKEQFLDLDLWSLSLTDSEELRNQIKLYTTKLRQVGNVKFNWVFKGRYNSIEAEVAIVELVIGKQMLHQCVIHDVTEKNNSIRALERSTKNFESVLDSAPEGIFIIDKQEILYSNKEAFKILNTDKINRNELFVGEDQAKFDRLIEGKIEDSKPSESILLLNDGNKGVLAEVTIVNTIFGAKEAVLVILKDISFQIQLSKEVLRAELAEENSKKLSKEIKERIKAENEIQNLLLKTKAIYDSSSNIFLVTLDLDGRVTYFNKHSESYFKQVSNRDIKIGDFITDYFKSIFDENLIIEFQQIFTKVIGGKSRQFEVEFNYFSDHLWIEIFMNPIYDTEGNVSEVSLIYHDITVKKRSEKETNESLKEKEVLLKEIHHRVKNNLQVISSILNLQSSFVQDPGTLEILQESRNRIRSMAIIHENLYRTTNFSSIDFEGYLKNLVLNLSALYQRSDCQINIIYDLQPVEISIDQAVPSGLIMNELITNALKYAFIPGDDRSNELLICMKEEEGTIYLQVSDNGVGLSDDINYSNSDTLGLQLVVTLCEQLDGSMSLESTNGTNFLISFEKL